MRPVLLPPYTKKGWGADAAAIDDEGDAGGGANYCNRKSGRCTPQYSLVWPRGGRKPIFLKTPTGPGFDGVSGIVDTYWGQVLMTGTFAYRHVGVRGGRVGLWSLNCPGPGEKPSVSFLGRIPLLPGQQYSNDASINSQGTVVGSNGPSTARPGRTTFIYQNGKLRNLDALVPVAYDPLGGVQRD